MYITIKYMKLKTSVVYVHSVALKVKFEERKGDKGFKNKCFEVVIRLYKSRCLGNFLTKVTDDMLSGSGPQLWLLPACFETPEERVKVAG